MGGDVAVVIDMVSKRPCLHRDTRWDSLVITGTTGFTELVSDSRLVTTITLILTRDVSVCETK